MTGMMKLAAALGAAFAVGFLAVIASWQDDQLAIAQAEREAFAGTAAVENGVIIEPGHVRMPW